MRELKMEDVQGIVKQAPSSAIWKSYYDDGMDWVGLKRETSDGVAGTRVVGQCLLA